MQRKTIILGGGMTGLAAGIVSGAQVFEASDEPGGICSSYYIPPGQKRRLSSPPDNNETYRFEIGGGHWIFGGEPDIVSFIENYTAVKAYERDSSVLLKNMDINVPYPIQDHLEYFSSTLSDKIRLEMNGKDKVSTTMKEWLEQTFGPTLCGIFFFPFHELYTAGIYSSIAPQDVYKSPVNKKETGKNKLPSGYNTRFVYPEKGLDALSRAMAADCEIKFNKKVVKIDVEVKRILFSDGSNTEYDYILSTLPLNRMAEMAGLSIDCPPAPYTSVLVLNIGAEKGSRCPDAHWIYTPESIAGFHRMGFYSNVDRSFLPASLKEANSHISIYVERAFEGGCKPGVNDIELYTKSVIKELKEYRYIKEISVVDPTWIDIAYTWNRPGSTWKEQCIKILGEHDIFQAGRYARWNFMGIADSIREGINAGTAISETGLNSLYDDSHV
jgi:protoporphyrinogen oxidase